MVRGAFEYQGQKCSAMSRAYIPKSLWPEVKEKFISEVKTIKVGSPKDFTNFMNAVIDKTAFDTISDYIQFAKNMMMQKLSLAAIVMTLKGYFIEPYYNSYH